MDLLFKPYTGKELLHNAHPARMEVGQVVVRKAARKSHILVYVRKAMKQGMEFSIAEEDGKFAIRRDK